jgi:hypothetical protein
MRLANNLRRMYRAGINHCVDQVTDQCGNTFERIRRVKRNLDVTVRPETIVAAVIARLNLAK